MKWYSRDANGVETPLGGSGQTIQVDSLPVASTNELNNIYQYVGADTLTLKNGYFYKCVSDGQDPATYSWVQTDTQPATPIATEHIVGKVKPDGETITIDPDGTIHALGGGGGVRLANVSGAEVTSVKQVAYIKWSDPPDYTVSGIPLAQWEGTKVLRKVGSAPTGADDEDAILIVDNKVRDAYASTPFEDNTVQYGVQYYYKFFPYTVDELYTNGSAVGIFPDRIVIEDVPSQNGRLEYTGTSQSPIWNDYDSDKLIIGGDTSATTVGVYTATFTPKSDYVWADGTQSTVNVTWTINNIAIAAVPTQAGDLLYTGTVQSPTWNGYDPDELTISGDTSGTAIGTYTATFTPKANYEWWDGTTTGKTADWTISEVTITTVPTQQGTLTYDGTVQTVVWNNFDTDQLTVTGNTATNAGTYTASFIPKSGYKWSDGTITAKTASWTIEKAEANAILSANSVTLDETHNSAEVTITNPTGDILVISSDSTKVSANYNSSTGVVTLSMATPTYDTIPVTVNINSSINYNSGTKNINVICRFFSIKDWKDGVGKGTDSEIATMIEAADNGDLDLSLYWSIGDERTVHINTITNTHGAFAHNVDEQDIVMVLMDDHYMNQNIHYVVGQKDCLSDKVQMYPGDYSTGSWANSKSRAALNSEYYDAFSSPFKGIFKSFETTTISEWNGHTLQTTVDVFALFAETEIFGNDAAYSQAEEKSALSQIYYYQTSSNRIKNILGTANPYWERTPFNGNGTGFCNVSATGGVYGLNSSAMLGFAPFGCI